MRRDKKCFPPVYAAPSTWTASCSMVSLCSRRAVYPAPPPWHVQAYPLLPVPDAASSPACLLYPSVLDFTAPTYPSLTPTAPVTSPVAAHRQAGVDFASAALSGQLSSIGYFYGSSSLSSPKLAAPTLTQPAPLTTVVPCRPFFPRGFLVSWSRRSNPIASATAPLNSCSRAP